MEFLSFSTFVSSGIPTWPKHLHGNLKPTKTFRLSAIYLFLSHFFLFDSTVCLSDFDPSSLCPRFFVTLSPSFGSVVALEPSKASTREIEVKEERRRWKSNQSYLRWKSNDAAEFVISLITRRERAANRQVPVDESKGMDSHIEKKNYWRRLPIWLIFLSFFFLSFHPFPFAPLPLVSTSKCSNFCYLCIVSCERSEDNFIARKVCYYGEVKDDLRHR